MPRPQSVGMAALAAVTAAASLSLVGVSHAAAAALPTVTSAAPTAGPSAGGSTVTIHGSGFTHVTSVHFASKSATSIHVLSSTKLTAVAPAHAAGTIDVRVHTAAGTSATHSADHFRYVESPDRYISSTVDTPHGTPADVSCVSSTDCVVVDARGSVVTWNGTVGSAPVSVTGGGPLAGVSCPSATSCMAVGAHGASYSFDGSTWTKITVANNPNLVDVSCLGSTFCIAVDDAGNAYQFDGSTWSRSVIDANRPLRAVSCSADTFCVAVDGIGDEMNFTGTAWTAPQDIDAALPLVGISCPSTSFCMAFDSQGNAVELSGGTWSSTAVSHDGMAVSCASATECLAVGFDAGPAFEFTAGGWIQITEPSRRYTAQSCLAGARQCVAVSEQGDLTVTTDSDPNPVNIDLAATDFAVSCPTATSCVAVDDLGEAFRATNGAWAALSDVVPVSLFTFVSPVISCVSKNWCMADGAGLSQSSDDSPIQIFKGTTWVDAPGGLDSPALQAISCLSTSFCVAIDYSGDAMLWDGTRWSAPASIDGSKLAGASCASPTLCVAIDVAGRALSFNGRSWSNPAWIDGSRSLDLVSCGGRTCHVADSHDSLLRFDGTSWSRGAQLSSPISAMSCLPTDFCYALVDSGAAGMAVQGTVGKWVSTAVPIGAAVSAHQLSCVAGPTCEAIDPDGSAFRGADS